MQAVRKSPTTASDILSPLLHGRHNVAASVREVRVRIVISCLAIALCRDGLAHSNCRSRCMFTRWRDTRARPAGPTTEARRLADRAAPHLFIPSILRNESDSVRDLNTENAEFAENAYEKWLFGELSG
jgi:hypothetical protein